MKTPKSTTSKKTKKSVAFTLIELIIVIAIISILAAILLLALNPAQIFRNARNAQRQSDVQLVQGALAKFLAESAVNGTARSLYQTTPTIAVNLVAIGNSGAIGTPATTGLISNVTSVGAYATTTPVKCDSGASGLATALVAANGYQILTTGSGTGTTADFAQLVAQGYFSKVPADPTAGAGANSGYYLCIDTTVPSGSTNSAPGGLVIYAPNVETSTNGVTVPYSVI